MTRCWSLALVTGIACLVALGCSNTETVDATGGAPRQVSSSLELVAQSRPPVPDVAVPLGFKLDEGKSRNFAAAGARYVDHVYKGPEDKWAVARFYKRHMPVNRWTLVTDKFVQGNIELDFDKETERCQVTIGNGDLFHKTVIKLALWTSGRVEIPKELPETARPIE